MRRLIASSLLLCLLAACSTPPVKPLKTVAHVDLDRYMGTWHVIARIPSFITDGKVASSDTYHLREDGSIGVTYRFRHGVDAQPVAWHGFARIPDASENTHWKMHIIWPFVADYMILAVDPQYRYTMIGTPSRDMLWIMARGTSMPDAAYRRYRHKAHALGFAADRLRKVPQAASR